nr:MULTISPECIES: GlsB/YeaQ/YmgE family stress response membrane protein [Vitreoscilla]
MNIIIGIVGSALGSWLFGSVLKIGAANNAGNFNIPGLLFGVLGAVVLIFLARLIF